MKVGYARTMSRSKENRHSKNKLLDFGVSELFIDPYGESEKNLWQRVEFKELLNFLQRGDTVVVTSLEQISLQYSTLIELISELLKRRIAFKVLELSEISTANLYELLVWVNKNEQRLAPKVNRFKLTPETQRDREKYHFWTRNPEDKQKYWQIIQGLMTKTSLRKLARSVGVPQGTVYRIKKHYDKLKQTAVLVGIFLITIASLKIAQSYSSNWGIQVLICGVMTVGIVWFSYSDSQGD